MNRISNALVIDDKMDSLFDPESLMTQTERQQLKSIHEYFMKNSIPFSVINDLGSSPMDAIQRIKTIPKPDLVVLDLDLNSNGNVDDADIDLLVIILKELSENFGEFIILIYSTLSENWEEVKKEILQKEESLTYLLIDENVIVEEKFLKLNHETNERLTTEIIAKSTRYFGIIGDKVLSYVNNNWNKEIAIISVFTIGLIFIIQFSFSESNSWLFAFAILIIIVSTLTFIALNLKTKSKEDE